MPSRLLLLYFHTSGVASSTSMRVYAEGEREREFGGMQLPALISRLHSRGVMEFCVVARDTVLLSWWTTFFHATSEGSRHVTYDFLVISDWEKLLLNGTNRDGSISHFTIQ